MAFYQDEDFEGGKPKSSSVQMVDRVEFDSRPSTMMFQRHHKQSTTSNNSDPIPSTPPYLPHHHHHDELRHGDVVNKLILGIHTLNNSRQEVEETIIGGLGEDHSSNLIGGDMMFDRRGGEEEDEEGSYAVRTNNGPSVLPGSSSSVPELLYHQYAEYDSGPSETSDEDSSEEITTPSNGTEPSSSLASPENEHLIPLAHHKRAIFGSAPTLGSTEDPPRDVGIATGYGKPPPEMLDQSKKPPITTRLSIMKPISTQMAKNRSFLHGSVGCGALLGAEELERYFPDRILTIFCVTWNMAQGRNLPEVIDDILLPTATENLQDLYVIATQESIADKREWEIRLQATLGPSHVLLYSGSHGVLYLSLFIRRDLIWFCSIVEQSVVTTRPGTMIKTKGAIGLGFQFFGTTFLFINSHLKAGESRVKERILDHDRITQVLDIPRALSVNPYKASCNDVTNRFEKVFWLGDLNFRLTQTRQEVITYLEETSRLTHPNYTPLLDDDQLLKLLREEKAFKGFHEHEIKFSPTYKYNKNSDVRDTTPKQRTPSYTDRILYKCQKSEEGIKCVHYERCDNIRSSDHRPVYAIFQVQIRPGKDSIPLSGGLFHRDIYIEAIKRRTEALKKKQSSVCSVM